ncbi:GNAT family N-acetyltransferase [Georgenia sp. SYP-B2076]|uniref:GNAT family N-acetyltransferase n=1 Tax=Georgenia sp. SYP-B2076 TaxID=2495881 RepID=UPI000F8DA827|nr:GNAT family N-acetyltransferase [Georgenia sp. SYP-B2076]
MTIPEGTTTSPAGPVRILEGQAASERAARALARYYAELGERIEGFDVSLLEAADPTDVTPPHGDFMLLTELVTGTVLGCGGVRVLSGTEVELRRMWLSPDARGKGLGRFLLRALENRARSLGGRRVVLSVNEALTEAVSLYESAGYEPTTPFGDNPFVQIYLGKDLG